MGTLTQDACYLHDITRLSVNEVMECDDLNHLFSEEVKIMGAVAQPKKFPFFMGNVEVTKEEKEESASKRLKKGNF